jgi:glutathione S-transferase
MTRLYHFALSPFCRKVRLVLAEKKIDVELVDEKVLGTLIGVPAPQPGGQGSVLKIDGLTLTESNAICEYIEETHPDPALMPVRSPRPGRGRRLVAWFDDKFHHEVTKNLVYERVNKKVMRAGYPDGKAVKAGARRSSITCATWNGCSTIAAGWRATV